MGRSSQKRMSLDWKVLRGDNGLTSTGRLGRWRIYTDGVSWFLGLNGWSWGKFPTREDAIARAESHEH